MTSMDRGFDQPSARVSRGLGLRGIVAIAFGIVLLVWPAPTVTALLYAFGAVAVADGVLAIWTAFDAAPKGERWWLVVSGLAGIVFGVAVWVWPDLSAVALLYAIGAWAIVTGAAELAGALFGPLRGGSRLLLTLRGLLSIAFGGIMFARPGAGALALITLIAAFSIVTGLALVAMAREVRRSPERVEELFRDAEVPVS